jgi:cobalt-zinc-cadmium efflux system outer membrane protein
MPCYLKTLFKALLTTFGKLLMSRKTLLPIAVAAAVSGCAGSPTNLGHREVDHLVEQRGRPIPSGSAQTLIDSLLSETLKPETAVALALANNHELAIEYAYLGLGAAELQAAGRIRNPGFAAEILHPNRSDERNQLGFGLVVPLTDLLTLPARKRLATAQFAALRQEVGASVLDTASAAERAYYDYVFAQQKTAVQQQLARAAETALQLAERFYRAGNISPREFVLAQSAAAEQILKSLDAKRAEAHARGVLAGVLGVAVDGSWQTIGQLPEPDGVEHSLKELTTLAAQSRLDLAAAKARAATLADQLRLTDRMSSTGEIDIGLAFEKESDGAELFGPVLEWEVPAFSRNQPALIRGRAELEAAVIEHRKVAIEVNNQVHLAHARLISAKAMADTYRRQLIPARVAATDRAQEEANFMLIGSFELIQIKQNEYAGYLGYLAAVRDYWLAHSELRQAVGNRLPGRTTSQSSPVDLGALFRPQTPSPHEAHKAHEAHEAHKHSKQARENQHQHTTTPKTGQ